MEKKTVIAVLGRDAVFTHIFDTLALFGRRGEL